MAGPEQQKGDPQGSVSNVFPSMPPIPEYNLEFRFSSNPQAKLMRDLEWRAELLVKAKDIPSLMKHGFHGNETNIQEGTGYFGGPEILPARDPLPNWWKCARVYLLKDEAEDPQWEAQLTIFALQIPFLSAFRIAQLSTDKIDYTAAWDNQKRFVYLFEAQSQHLNFNAHYDDKPLQGWWPWPKEGQSGMANLKREQEDGDKGVVDSNSEEEEWDRGWVGGEDDLI